MRCQVIEREYLTVPYRHGLFCSGEGLPTAWRRWGDGGGPQHLFVDDYRFEVVWRHPLAGLERATRAGWVTCPDFSIYSHWPVEVGRWQAWRSAVVGTWWAAHGVHVVPVAMWGSEVPELYIRKGSVIAVRGPGRGSELWWMRGAKEVVARYQPGSVIQFGRQEGAEAWGCLVHFFKINGEERYGRQR